MSAGSLIAAAAAVAQKQAADAADAAWGGYAKARDLTFRPSRITESKTELPRVTGKSDGVSVAFELSSFEGDWGIQAVSVPLSPIRVRVQLAPEGLMQKISKIFGAQDIVLGDPAFDETYMVQGTTDPETHALLVAPLRSELLANDVATLLYDDGSTSERGPLVILGIRSLLTAHDALDRMLRLLVMLAKARPAAP